MKCDQCGNDYDRIMTIEVGGQTLHFDSFECAIHRLAPPCGHCGCRVIGHGIDGNGTVYCCAHCAQSDGHSGARDNV